jgi:hypothetical protein
MSPRASRQNGGLCSVPGRIMWDLDGQSGTVEGFLRVRRILLPIFNPATAPRSLITRRYAV